MSDVRTPLPSTPCPQCGAQVIAAAVYEAQPRVNRVVLDAAVTADGTYSAWMAPRAPGMPGAGVWLARLAPIDVGWHGSLRRVHQCRPRDTQLSLDEASAA